MNCNVYDLKNYHDELIEEMNKIFERDGVYTSNKKGKDRVLAEKNYAQIEYIKSLDKNRYIDIMNRLDGLIRDAKETYKNNKYEGSILMLLDYARERMLDSMKEEHVEFQKGKMLFKVVTMESNFNAIDIYKALKLPESDIECLLHNRKWDSDFLQPLIEGVDYEKEDIIVELDKELDCIN